LSFYDEFQLPRKKLRWKKECGHWWPALVVCVLRKWPCDSRVKKLKCFIKKDKKKIFENRFEFVVENSIRPAGWVVLTHLTIFWNTWLLILACSNIIHIISGARVPACVDNFSEISFARPPDRQQHNNNNVVNGLVRKPTHSSVNRFCFSRSRVSDFDDDDNVMFIWRVLEGGARGDTLAHRTVRWRRAYHSIKLILFVRFHNSPARNIVSCSCARTPQIDMIIYNGGVRFNVVYVSCLSSKTYSRPRSRCTVICVEDRLETTVTPVLAHLGFLSMYTYIYIRYVRLLMKREFIDRDNRDLSTIVDVICVSATMKIIKRRRFPRTSRWSVFINRWIRCTNKIIIVKPTKIINDGKP